MVSARFEIPGGDSATLWLTIVLGLQLTPLVLNVVTTEEKIRKTMVFQLSLVPRDVEGVP